MYIYMYLFISKQAQRLLKYSSNQHLKWKKRSAHTHPTHPNHII